MSGFGYRNLGFGGGNYVPPVWGEIPNSLRFDGQSAYLARTPSASNRRTWTFSAWIKRSEVGAGTDANDRQRIFSQYTTSADVMDFILSGEGYLSWYDYVSGYRVQLTANVQLRDPAAWYHVMIVLDTTQGTAADRAKMYMNGTQVTSFAYETYPSQNADLKVNTNTAHHIGRNQQFAASQNWDGYMAEIHFVDGTALTPTTFGEAGDYGEWKAKEVSGVTYGTNGYYLDFKLSTASAAGIGADQSGNGNNWTPSGLAATDQMLDSPTNNFCTMSSLRDLAAVTYSEGNCWSSLPAGDNNNGATGTIAPAAGKWYWEVTSTHTPVNIGIADSEAAESALHYSGVGMTNYYHHTGIKWVSGSNSAYGASASVGDIIGTALDMDNRTIEFFKNGSSLGTAFTIAPGTNMAPAAFGANASNVKIMRWNFGQDSSFAGTKTGQNNADGNGYGDFYYAPPSGFLALCTKNMAAPAVIPSAHFNTVLYTGNATTNHQITGVGFQPDLVWGKSRNFTEHHTVLDAVRGSIYDLYTDSTAAENQSNAVTSFDSDGFTLDYYDGTMNRNTSSMVAWNWKAGGASSTNTNGSISAAVSANVNAGFSIIKWTKDGSSGTKTVGHGLSAAPQIIIFKEVDDPSNWSTYVGVGGSTTRGLLYLNLTAAQTTNDANQWSDTAPTSTVFTYNQAYSFGGNNDKIMIGYAFHSVDGYSKMGSYTGNGNADGAFVYTGFRPAYVLVKATGTENWAITDTARSPYNNANLLLRPDETTADTTGAMIMDFLANGFKFRNTDTKSNSAQVYIYMAFAETPFKYANAR